MPKQPESEKPSEERAGPTEPPAAAPAAAAASDAWTAAAVIITHLIMMEQGEAVELILGTDDAMGKMVNFQLIL